MKTISPENGSRGCAALYQEESSPAGCYETRADCALGDCPQGARVRIRELRGCRGVLSRLYSLGFTPGTVITVYEGGGPGGFRVEVRDTCVVLDSHAAGSIVCDPVF